MHAGFLPSDFGKQSGLADPGVTRDQHHTAGSIALGAPHDTQRGRQHVIAAA